MLMVGTASATPGPPAILVFGDSISAGFGLPHVEQGWVELLRKKLKNEGYGYEVINASVSGETTAGGLARLSRALSLHHPTVVVIELGGNDGLRALPLDQMRSNLTAMVDMARASGAQVLLLGIRIPPNYGPEYTERFRAVYLEIAREKKTPLVPFFLEGIALSPELMQADGISPERIGSAETSDERVAGTQNPAE